MVVSTCRKRFTLRTLPNRAEHKTLSHDPLSRAMRSLGTLPSMLIVTEILTLTSRWAAGRRIPSQTSTRTRFGTTRCRRSRRCRLSRYRLRAPRAGRERPNLALFRFCRTVRRGRGYLGREVCETTLRSQATTSSRSRRLQALIKLAVSYVPSHHSQLFSIATPTSSVWKLCAPVGAFRFRPCLAPSLCDGCMPLPYTGEDTLLMKPSSFARCQCLPDRRSKDLCLQAPWHHDLIASLFVKYLNCTKAIYSFLSRVHQI